ncbi:MAG: LacI family DNA-binding transcriptional regulator [Oscillospiraceae bacterium]|nr:LacI family DNA-binding transcriptional regulator [Oscillospiraceae bacterium]
MCAKRTTMQDIARAAEVSQSTVSMILNGKSAAFPAATIEKVRRTAAAMNYSFRPAPAVGANQTVLVVTVQLTNPYYAAMQQGVDRAAAPHSINIITACTYHDPAMEEALLQMALSQHLMGVIFLYPPDNEQAFLDARLQIPIVTICDRASNVAGDIVELNNFQAGVLAAKHLLDLGHTSIAVLTHVSDRATTSRATRVAGILSEIKQVLPEDRLLLLNGNNARSGYLSENSFHYRVGYALAQSKKLYQNNITGLICVNDMLAYGVMDALTENGYDIPRDFSVIGSDNLLFSGMSRVSLTTIEHYPGVIAQSALTTLLNRVQMSSSWNNARFQVQCQPTLVVRGSTGTARTEPLTAAEG